MIITVNKYGFITEWIQTWNTVVCSPATHFEHSVLLLKCGELCSNLECKYFSNVLLVILYILLVSMWYVVGNTNLLQEMIMYRSGGTHTTCNEINWMVARILLRILLNIEFIEKYFIDFYLNEVYVLLYMKLIYEITNHNRQESRNIGQTVCINPFENI
jgi:hypothetical protein